MTLFIPILPMATPRGRCGKYGVYNPKKYADYKKNIVNEVQKTFKESPLKGEIFMRILFMFPMPASWGKARKSSAFWKVSKPDLDNLVKGVKDALNGVVYVDDAQVVAMNAIKRYCREDEVVGIEIFIHSNENNFLERNHV